MPQWWMRAMVWIDTTDFPLWYLLVVLIAVRWLWLEWVSFRWWWTLLRIRRNARAVLNAKR